MINTNDEQVILVDEFDNQVGTMDKLEAHRKGVLHRAFSIIIYNSSNQILLQQRAFSKYHSGGLWTNACCSHPRPGELLLDAANRRLFEETGITCSLEAKGSFIYKSTMENGLTEYEYDYVFCGTSDQVPVLIKAEAEAYKYVEIQTLLKEISCNPESFTFWFKEIINRGFAGIK